MNVRLAAQTLSSSVADAIEFLDIGMKNPNFKNSNGTVKFVRIIDRLFDMLNSRNPVGKEYKQPLRLANKATYEEILRSTAEYLLSLKTNSTPSQLLATHRRKTFIVGFVANIKSTIEMANQMFSIPTDPFKYLLTYKYSQDHLELLFSCIRARGGMEQQPQLLTVKICPSPNDDEKCHCCFKKWQLPRFCRQHEHSYSHFPQKKAQVTTK